MTDAHEPSAKEQAKRAGGWLIVILFGAAILAAVLGLFLVGPLGLVIGIPVAIVLVLLFGASSAGPAAGA